MKETQRLLAISRSFWSLACCLLAFASQPLHAQGFSAVVSPPRIESGAKAGETYRDVIEIANVGGQINRLAIKTADWTLDANGGPLFSDTLAPESCRPWVAIEKRDLSLAPSAKYRFRFEVAVPAGTAPRECRFAVMIEGATQKVDAGALNVPVSGRIGVIVYLEIGAVASQLTLDGYGSRTASGMKLPSLKLTNHGTAHARLEGFVDATDTAGQVFTMAPANLPILPGEQREIVLSFQEENDAKKAKQPRYPLTLKGRVYDGRTPLEVNTTFTP